MIRRFTAAYNFFGFLAILVCFSTLSFAQEYILGSASGTSFDQTLNPFSKGNNSSIQMLIRKSELDAISFPTGDITSLGAWWTGAPGENIVRNVTISIAHTNLTELTFSNCGTGVLCNLNSPIEVFNGDIVDIVTGDWTDINFSSAFNWNGSDNIIIEICKSADLGGGNNGTIQFTSPGFTTRRYSTGSCGVNTGVNSFSTRARLRLGDGSPSACSGVPSPAVITVDNSSPLCNSGTRELSASNVSDEDGTEVVWKYRTNPTGTYSSISGATSEQYTTSTLTETHYYVLETTCSNSGESVLSNEIEVEVLSPTISSVSPSSTCEEGTVTLSATPSTGASIEWYANSTGGSAIHSGNNYNPSITSTTTYYAEAKIGSCVSSSRTAVTATLIDVESLINDEVAPTEQIQVNDFVWVGNTSTDWSNSGNWRIFNGNALESTSSLPSSSENAYIIPNSVNSSCFGANQPILTATGESKSIFIVPNAILGLSNQELKVYGDFVNNGHVNAGTGKVSFHGTGAQNIYGETDFYDITLEKIDETHEVILQNHISVANFIDLQGGALKLNFLSIDLGATGQLLNENENSYIYCNCPSAFIRSEGIIDAGTVSNLGNLGLTIETAVDRSMGSTEILRRHESVNVGGGTNINRIYSVTPSENNGDLNATISINYLTHENEANLSENDLSIYRSTDGGASWNEEGGLIDPVNNTITFFNWNEFSDATIAEGTMSDVLPVEMEYFTVDCNNNKSVLHWKTASELNAAFFEVQFSEDGMNWKKLEQVSAQGTTSIETEYKFIDSQQNRNSSISYYRLRQVDYDGEESLFGPLSVECQSSGVFKVFPNPTRDNVQLAFFLEEKTHVVIEVYDLLGKLTFSNSQELMNGMNSIPLDFSGLSKGIYVIKVQTDNGQLIGEQKVVKE